MIGNNESPAAAATRVLTEKVNIEVDPSQLVDMGMEQYGLVCGKHFALLPPPSPISLTSYLRIFLSH
jgi:hypothetical protein